MLSILFDIRHHTALSVICTALRDHIGHPSEGDILQQALVAAIQTCQAYVAAPTNIRVYLGNNTCAMVCYAGIFILKVRTRMDTAIDYILMLGLTAARAMARARYTSGKFDTQTLITDCEGHGGRR